MPAFLALVAVLVAVALVLTATRRRKPARRRATRPEPDRLAQKGADGEDALAETLRAILPPQSRILRNLIIPKPDGATNELDLIAVTPAGLLVCESKCLTGWIFGDTAGQSWTQSLPAGDGSSVKHQFLNPLHQNAAHVRRLRELLAQAGHTPPIRSIIAFTGDARLKSVPPYAPGHVIATLRDLPAAIHAILATADQTLDATEIDAIAQTLDAYAHATPEQIASHIAAIKTPTQCPRCGAPLTQRVAAKGDHAGQTFLACTRFPKCRFTLYPDASEA